MRRLVGVLLVAGILGVSTLTAVGGPEDQSGPGVISPSNTKIEWVGTKKGGKHTGGFKDFSGKLTPANADAITGTTISVEIKTSSLYSDAPKLTQHLKSPDFFGVDTYPKASFVSTKIEAAADGTNTHKITGDLTLHGVKHEISFPAKIDDSASKVKLTSTFKINREEFGMNYGKGMVNNEVTVKLTLEVARK
jgi:polyisoprenoid-binding protein YceI